MRRSASGRLGREDGSTATRARGPTCHDAGDAGGGPANADSDECMHGTATTSSSANRTPSARIARTFFFFL